MPQWQPARRSSSGAAVLLIVFGVLGLVMTSFVWLGTAYLGYGAAAGSAVAAAVAACMVVVGIMWKAKGSSKAIASAVTTAVVLGLFIGAGPTASMGIKKSSERRQWDELMAFVEDPDSDPLFDPEIWRESYYELDELRRDGWEAQWMLARVRRAKSDRDIAGTRDVLREIEAREKVEAFAEARQEAASFLDETYAAAQKKLAAPAGEDADERLRSAFATMLHDFASQPDAHLYVSFSQTANLQPPPGDVEELAALRREPDLQQAFPNGAPVIGPGEAFTGRFDARRRDMFVSTMSEAFRNVFDDELLQLVPLPEVDAREGKYVLEVNATIERVPYYGTYYQTDDLGVRVTKGLTFEFIVRWSFALVGPDGEVRYEAPETISQAAPDVGLGAEPAPQWAIYGALMDSAYYNYSRRVVMDFGLPQPAERTIFPYSPTTMGV